NFAVGAWKSDYPIYRQGNGHDDLWSMIQGIPTYRNHSSKPGFEPVGRRVGNKGIKMVWTSCSCTDFNLDFCSKGHSSWFLLTTLLECFYYLGFKRLG